MSTFYIKQGNLSPSLRFQFVDEGTGAPTSLTGWTLAFHMRRVADSQVVIDRSAVVDADPLYGRFDWATGDTSVPGTYEAEVKGTPPNNRPLTAPNQRHVTVEIVPAIVP